MYGQKLKYSETNKTRVHAQKLIGALTTKIKIHVLHGSTLLQLHIFCIEFTIQNCPQINSRQLHRESTQNNDPKDADYFGTDHDKPSVMQSKPCM